ncbi:acyl carrier protein [Streptomyces sp. SL13]|uniref:Acyl carrier protein n=1 Tax=Streptantibioticus silvisoli TaxID=2705255 RepID=A0AA90KFN5_9ACTN|nr:acyl carrier protein [Streptantibioticus silvisoli]MDI5962484.1 acyl carrier protein [Streptantibioticus silvisoli]MDI5969119.1 acyl carrier protein [Streptantibioticus silvisoli]
MDVGAELRGLPRLELREELEELVVSLFREQLLMEDEEELDQELSYFDLGLTSLRLMELKKRLEARLGVEIDATVLFNQPTVERLLDHLTDTIGAAAPAAG